jgi:prefoldin subunit 5
MDNLLEKVESISKVLVDLSYSIHKDEAIPETSKEVLDRSVESIARDLEEINEDLKSLYEERK